MRRTSSILLLLLLMASFSTYCSAQLWSGVLSPNRAIDWSRAGVAGGIPDTSGNAPCATLAPGSTAAQINSAISSSACQGGTLASPKVIQLSPAGTYNLSGGISFSAKKNIVLKGLGADQTILKFTGTTAPDFGTGAASILVWGGEANCCNGVGGTIQHSATWTGTTEGGAGSYPKGASHLTLSSVTGLSVGNIIVLDQNWDTTGWPNSDDIVVSASAPSWVVEGEGGAFPRNGRGLSLVHTVANISGTTVTIDPPLEVPNIQSGRSPGAWWGNVTASGIGIEDLTIDSLGNGAHASLVFYNSVNCWAKGIRSMVAANGSFLLGIQMVVSHRITIRDSYVYGPANNANTNYGISPNVNSDALIENNILDNIQSPIVSDDPDAGSVAGYNFFTNSHTAASSFTPHGVGKMFVLNEGNDGTGSTDDVIHGTQNFGTYFRNRFDGGPLGSAVHWTQAHNRFFNYIGEVLGASGYRTYQTAQGEGYMSIFSLGDHRNGSFSDDPRVAATAMRWGNYDTANAAARFVSSEVPSGIANFSNPVPTSQALPASFYLNGKPAWFGSVPFPPIGPDVTGGDITGYAGHAYKIPARLCYESAANDPAYSSSSPRIKTFSAASCYPQSGGSTPPNPPTSLTVVVQ